VLRASCRPQGEEMVIRISEGPTAADRHEARVPDLREDHGWQSFLLASAPRVYVGGRRRSAPKQQVPQQAGLESSRRAVVTIPLRTIWCPSVPEVRPEKLRLGSPDPLRFARSESGAGGGWRGRTGSLLG
jgi:hypothetical protein